MSDENLMGEFGQRLVVKKFAAMVPVSRTLMLAHGLVNPTPEEAAEMKRERAEWLIEMARRSEVMERAKEQLSALEDGMTHDLLDLHMDLDGYCDGCDYSGYEGERPDWPCRTVQTIAAYHGIELP